MLQNARRVVRLSGIDLGFADDMGRLLNNDKFIQVQQCVGDRQARCQFRSVQVQILGAAADRTERVGCAGMALEIVVRTHVGSG